MGNLCSKSANPTDNFAGQGRVVGTAPKPASSAPVPQKITTTSPGRPLGGGESGGVRSDGTSNARSEAARAAVVGVLLYLRCLNCQATESFNIRTDHIS
jgi:hypothetical protein